MMLGFKETVRFIVASSKEINFLNGGMTESESGQKDFYYLEKEGDFLESGRFPSRKHRIVFASQSYKDTVMTFVQQAALP